MNDTYLLGLDDCKNISIAIPLFCNCVFLVVLFIMFFFDNDDSYNFGDKIEVFVFSLLFSMGISFSVSISLFLLSYPLWNLYLQEGGLFNLQVYSKEITQGTLGLRITSLLLSFSYLQSLYNAVADRIPKITTELVSDYPDLKDIKPFSSNSTIKIIIITQNIFYGAITLLLWIFIFSSKSLIELRIVSWGLFFIVDDWAIIHDNLIALKGRILRWHRFRILFFNGLMTFSILSACFRKLEHGLFTGLISLLLITLISMNALAFFNLFESTNESN
ncbi:hypothetical protein ANSO36C_04000 [Nostoc cf. commune SO-36]|uniref:Uncharacterized protein n=1 Tax=Nostoc cf. commune SO-36 TaxID=449208 RepID=A0ABM7YVE1_NOSCO|nr:hypothetical protein [Nostoc commune]BDI14598.1 hypothetical protein ANSO36C_04000 [Nostoc cf. commune SO-36]